MRLPKNLLTGTYAKPRIFLCETNKERICQLETSNTNGSLKFNSYSELSFEVGRVYNDIITGDTIVNPYYDKIEALRLIELENFGFFELQGPELTGDGIKEAKSCTCYSYEYTLSQKYLEDFYINTGEVNSVEVINATSKDHIVPVTLYNPSNPKLSLLHLILEKDYAGWSIGHVDFSLQTLSRQFEVDRQSIYDFLMNEVCQKFNCYVVFDTINNTINLYAESLTSKFIGDGVTNTFTISPPFSQVGTVSIDGYKTTRWEYNASNGLLTLEDIPTSGAHIEVVDGALTEWETDVFVTFDNLSQEINISYDADSIKTCLTVTYGDDGDIREANLGLPYLIDLSYYYTVEWMGQDLYDAYTRYLQKCNEQQSEYTNNSQEMLNVAGYIDFEENRLSLKYALAHNVDGNTVGTYYTRGGTAPNYYYTSVSLPSEYNVNTTYYKIDGINLSEENVSNLFSALKDYFYSGTTDKISELSDEFQFMETYTISYLINGLQNAASDSEKESVIYNFLDEMWNQVGRTPLKKLYYESYKKVQITNIEAGWSQKLSPNYNYYYPVVLMLNSIERAIAKRDTTINQYQKEYDDLQNKNIAIANDLLMTNNFTEGQLLRLGAFLREDELHIDDIVETSIDTIADSFKVKQDAMETGRVELNKLCQPQFQFSMSMANIYALPEFEPIINQFQLGKVIKVGLRPDYIKQSRLLQVDINFEDFSDFSCEFGELTNLRSQSDIHADLLKKAVQAGKSVATNANYWTKGSEQANSIDLRLQAGLLGSIEALKAIDGTQNAYMDKYGLHLEVVNPDTGEIGDKRVWMVNNQIVFTDDGFKTSKSVLGEFTVDGETYYGLLAQAVIAGLVEGSTIKGGTIQIGEYYDDNGQKKYKFEVDENGNVTMNAASILGYVTSSDMNSAIEQTANSITSSVSENYATIGQAKHYGTCSTISSATAKAVVCSDFSLYTGATISVKFTYANSADSPTLNVNNTGDKLIYAYNGPLTATSSYNWARHSVVTFVYDGTYWRLSDSGALHQTASLSTKITQTAEDIVLEATRAKNAEADLSSKITINANAITSKVNSGDFGTLVEQNYDHVRIAWNKNSNYIQFEDGAMNIYTSSTHNDNTLLMKQNSDGAWYYNNGTTIGMIGTNNWTGDTSYKGLVFDIHYEASYMCWAAKNSSTDTYYDVKLIYHHKSSKFSQGLHFGSNTYADGYLYLTDSDRFRQWTDGGCGFDGRMTWCNKDKVNYVEIDGPNKSFNVFKGCNFTVNSGCNFKVNTTCDFTIHSGSKFMIGNDCAIDIYSNINMHKWYIIDTELVDSSDVRLKTNIQGTEVDALSLVNQIEMKEFDWIESGEHEDIGMIAQQLQSILPNLVHEDTSTGKLSIKTNKFIPYLIKAVQELTEYITGGVSTFSLRRGWTDPYTEEEKREFVSANVSNYNVDEVQDEPVIKEELERPKVLIPINQQGE